MQTGFVGALPHLFMTSIVPSGGLLADHLRKRGILSTTMVRKLFNCGGFGMEAFFFLIVACSDTPFAATMALTFGVAFSGFAISGFNVNHLDIAPQYASILMGLSNGIGTMAGFILPPVVDYMTSDHLKSSWKKVFLMSATIHFTGVCIYGYFASGELQPWAIPKGKHKYSSIPNILAMKNRVIVRLFSAIGNCNSRNSPWLHILCMIKCKTRFFTFIS